MILAPKADFNWTYINTIAFNIYKCENIFFKVFQLYIWEYKAADIDIYNGTQLIRKLLAASLAFLSLQ